MQPCRILILVVLKQWAEEDLEGACMVGEPDRSDLVRMWRMAAYGLVLVVALAVLIVLVAT